MAKVENIKGTSDKSCKCGTWLDHWKNKGGQPLPATCAVEVCPDSPEVGAHVKICDSFDAREYIVPFCSEHNQASGSLDVGDSLLVPAVNNTCS